MYCTCVKVPVRWKDSVGGSCGVGEVGEHVPEVGRLPASGTTDKCDGLVLREKKELRSFFINKIRLQRANSRMSHLVIFCELVSMQVRIQHSSAMLIGVRIQHFSAKLSWIRIQHSNAMLTWIQAFKTHTHTQKLHFLFYFRRVNFQFLLHFILLWLNPDPGETNECRSGSATLCD